jgi:hypothetical protein
MAPFFSNGQSTSLALKNSAWNIEISSTSGAISTIRHQGEEMNWVHPKYQWGTVILNSEKDTLKLDKPILAKQITATHVLVSYQERTLSVTVDRQLTAANELSEQFTIKNTGASMITLPTGAIDITAPFHDSYEGGAPVALNQNCHAHIWANGASSYVDATPMSGKGIHLGLILTGGEFAGYSLIGATFSNDRGRISFNPAAITLKPGQSHVISWKLFWNNGGDDFWTKALQQPNFVHLKANKYTFEQGEEIKFSAEAGVDLSKAILSVNGKPLALRYQGKKATALFKTKALGEQVFELLVAGKKSRLLTNVIADPMALVKARVNFIIDKQQRIDSASPLDGAYLIYDNETEKQYWATRNDWNEARERVGMGVLLALYLPQCKDTSLRTKIVGSLKRFEDFVAREIQDTAGIVYNSSHYKNNQRVYNSPWIGHFHLAMYQATHDRKYLDRLSKTITAYYAINRGRSFRAYPIGLQISDALNAFKEAGMTREYDKAYQDYLKHASTIAEQGINYPTSEVAYEQSIVAPGIQIELEMFLASKNPALMESVKQQMILLEAFNGEQPDYRLNDMAIRHWDDYWFGKYRAYGDTFPHYWQTVTATVFDEYAEATNKDEYRIRAKNILLNNLCLFTPDGRASCAYLYPLKSMGVTGQRFDPWANDQDWAMVNMLTMMNKGRF